MKKRAVAVIVLIFVIGIFLASFAEAGPLACGNEKMTKAMRCLDNAINESASLGLEEAIFAVLAGNPGNKALNKINAEKNADCWPKSGCTVKETAQATLALRKAGENETTINRSINWLKQQTGAPGEIVWYLQISIDGSKADNCTITYDGIGNRIEVKSDMTLSGDAVRCLSITSPSKYWLGISNDCVDKEFSVSCERNNFKANLLSKRSANALTVYVSPETKIGNPGSLISLKIKSKCFKKAGGCDYEGSLWAASALYQNREDVSEYIPYLAALAGTNQKYFPEAFLAFLLPYGDGTTNDYVARVIQKRITSEHWEIPGSDYGKFYDTGLGMLALGGADAQVNPLNYLFKTGVQETNGCWGTKRDTAFLIYSAGCGIRESAIISGSACGNGIVEESEQCDGTNFTIDKSCAVYNASRYSGGNLTCDNCAVSTAGCLLIEGGTEGPGPEGGEGEGGTCLDIGGTCEESCSIEENPSNYLCEDDTLSCCVNITEENIRVSDCEQAGNFCVANAQACISGGGEPLSSRDFGCEIFSQACCTRDVAEQLLSCYDMQGIVCRDDETCSEQEIEASDSDKCCLGNCEIVGEEGSSGGGGGTGGGTQQPEKSSLWIWILVLSILIILVIIGIVFRDKIRLWWFKFRGKAKVTPAGGEAGGGIVRRMPPRFGPPSYGRPMMRPMESPIRAVGARSLPPVRREQSPRDKELDETLKKLKKMSE